MESTRSLSPPLTIRHLAWVGISMRVNGGARVWLVVHRDGRIDALTRFHDVISHSAALYDLVIGVLIGLSDIDR